MADPFVGEIRIFGFNFAPTGWALCNGQLLPINQNQALFSLLGTTYGGNGQTNFALPNLQGCVPLHEGSGHTLGEKAAGEHIDHKPAADAYPRFFAKHRSSKCNSKRHCNSAHEQLLGQ